jgi:dTDP-4-amino-4,6-dideoxygalactose transaminase
VYIIGNDEVEAVRRVIESGQLFRYRGGEGGETDQFEAEWSEKIGVKHTIAVTSGTAALICALAGMGIGPGDEVIVPGYTFMATPNAVLAVGAVPIIAEIDESLGLDAADVEKKITPRTKAIIPVHMCGLPANMDAVMAVANRHGLQVLEDCCQADGGSYKGKRLGSIGHAGGFSFNHFKIISCGEGGAVTTDDDDTYYRALVHHDGGCAFRNHAAEVTVPFFAGSSFRTNEILSAILRVQLSRLDGILGKLRAEKRIMMDGLADVSAFTFNPINCIEGDCGTTLGLYFESAEQAREFAAKAGELGVGCGSPYDSGIHVYWNWEPILQQRGSYHPMRDAYQLTDVKYEYSEDMCPRTKEYLARTMYIGTSVDRSEDALMDMIAILKKAADAMTTGNLALRT